MDDLLRRYLRTKLDIGEPELVLEQMSRAEALGLGARATRASGPGERATRASGPPPVEPALPTDEIARLGRDGTAEEIAALPDLATLGAVARCCLRCPLHETRRHVVFGEGDPTASVVCIGEAPGAVEDETGRPFVGRAGQLLDRLLLAIGFPRESVYICNVLKCRPPNNRDPLPDEIEACSPFMLRQLTLIDPRVVVAFGAFAARTLLETKDSLGRLRGRLHRYAGYPVVVTYHPAALLRNPNWTRATWEDLQRVRRIVEGLEDPVVPSAPSDSSAAPARPENDGQRGLFG